MARIAGIAPGKGGLFVRLAYFMTKRRLGHVVTPIKIAAHHPRLLRAVAHMELGQEAARFVSPQLKALAQVKVATLIGCPFWIDIGSAVGRQQGLTDEKLGALDDFEGNPALSELEQLVVRYAVQMTQTPVDVHEETFNRLKECFNDQQLVELTSSVAWENYRARFDHAFGIEAEGFSEDA